MARRSSRDKQRLVDLSALAFRYGLSSAYYWETHRHFSEGFFVQCFRILPHTFAELFLLIADRRRKFVPAFSDAQSKSKPITVEIGSAVRALVKPNQL